MTSAREMASEFLNGDEEQRADPGSNENNKARQDERAVLERVFILWLIHDMLPWDLDEQGMSVGDIQAVLSKAGFSRTARTVQRDLDALMQIARVHYDSEKARPRRYHRFSEQRLTDCLPKPVRRVARYALAGPDWPGQIHVPR